MKFSIRTIPAAAAMTAALMFGGLVQAQSAGQPTTGSGDRAPIPAAPNAIGGTPGMTGKTLQQRNAAKPMAKQGAMAGSMGTGDAAAMPPGGTDQPVRQSGKVARNKAERMEKGNGQRSSMNKSNEPVRESDIKDSPAK